MILNKLKSKQKGQIVILDALFAIVFIMLLLFLVSKFVEIKIYSTNYNLELKKVNNTGDLAFKKLLTNSEYNCKIIDTDNNYVLSGCLVDNVSKITKMSLGIPNSYNCSLEINNFTFSSNACDDVLDVNANINTYIVDFNAVKSNTDTIAKHSYYNCLNNNCGQLVPVSGILKVWK